MGENIITYNEPQTSSTSCGASGRDTVKIFPIPTPKIIGRTSVCPGSTDAEYKDTVRFPGYSVTRDWVTTAGGSGFTVTQGLNTANDSVSIDFPTTPGVATLTLTNSIQINANRSCTAPTSFDISIKDRTKSKAPDGPPVFCTGTDSILYAAEFGSKYYHKWFIRGGGVGSKDYSLEQTAKVKWDAGAPEYWLWVRDSSALNDKCFGNSDTLKIKFTEDPYANFLVPFGGKDTTVCKGIEFTLKADPAGGETFIWESNTSTDSQGGPEWKVKPEKTTTYKLTVGKGMACDNKEDSITVSVKELPGDPLPQPDFSTCFEEVKDMSIIAKKDNPSNTVIWESNPLFSDVEYKINKPGTYSVVQKDSYGCPMAGTITVKDNCPVRIYVPQAFTPNQDNQNDSLRVFGNDRYETFHFRIFDRWGEVLFFTNNRNEAWGGNYYNGKIAPNGVYPWIVTYETISEDKKRETITRSGSITLIR